MKKRIHLLFLLLLAVSFTAGAQYWSDNQYFANGIHYETTGKNTVRVISVSGYSYSGAVVIPRLARITVYSGSSGDFGDFYEHDCLVTEIAPGAFSGCTGVTSIVIPNTVTTIGKNAFNGCTGLTSIDIPNSVTTIGASAFAGCTGLTSVTLPNSVQSMGWGVFYGCTSLASVTLSNNLSALDGTFQGCSALTSVTVPQGVKSLDGTFDGCTSLANVDLPRSIYYIGERTFNGCTALTGLRLPNALEYVGNMAFSNTGLTAIELPDGITSLGENAFYGSTALTIISTRAANPPLMSNSDGFSNETYSLANLLVPDFSLTSYQAADWWRLFQNIVGDAALNDPYDFVTGGIYYAITGNNTVEVTYKDRNYNSYSGTVNVPARVAYRGVVYDVTGVGNSAFRACTGLTSVSLPASVTTIGKHAFYGSGLTAINLPEPLTAIGDSAYCNTSDLSNLAALTIPENVVNIGTNAFKGVGVQSLTWNARECRSNGNMTTSGITQVTIGDEVAVIPDNFANGARITSLNLPNSVTTIGDYAFLNVSLTSLTIPAGVRKIGQNAFSGNYITSLTWNARECWTNGGMWTNNITQLTIGDDVTVLPENFAEASAITSLSIPASVKYISAYAFYNCKNLPNALIIPDSVVEIGEYAFTGSSVNTMTVGKSVEMVGCFALNGVTSLTWNAINCKTMGIMGTYDGHYNDNSLAFRPLVQVTIGDCVERIPNYFAYQAQISSVDIPSSVKEIGRYAFYDCDGLTEVIIPGSVTKLENDVFSYCDGLAFVSIPASVDTVRGFFACSGLIEASISAKHIESYAFYDCYNLSTLTLSAPLQSIGEGAFEYCTNLKQLSIPNTVTSITGSPFNGGSYLESIEVAEDNPVYDSRDHCNAVMVTARDSMILTCKNTVIPSGVTSISDYAFYNNTGLTSITIPATVTSIGTAAFSGCSNLAEISIPDGVNWIGSSAFSYCRSLTSVTLPQSLTSINSYTFSNCTSLRQVTIPDGVSSIGYGAFYYCTGLTSMDLPQSLTTISQSAFSNCRALTSIAIPAATSSIDRSAFSYCTALESIVIDAGNQVYDSRDNCNSIIETENNKLILGCKGSTIPGTVTSIGDYAFSGCSGLTSITIPSSITDIGTSAFYNCSGLTGINIPSSVTAIGSSAFTGCSHLTRVDITDLESWCRISFSTGDGNPLYFAKHLYLNGNEVTEVEIPAGLTEIKNHTFYGCKGLTAVTIPNTVLNINKSAFCYCSNLASVVIPESVTRIGAYAFAYCSNLTDAVIGDGVESIGDNAFYSCSKLSNVTFGNSVKTIGGFAFAYDYELTSIVLPASVTRLASGAFEYSYNLNDITCLATTPPSAEYWSFDGSSCYNYSTLRVPQEALSAYKATAPWKSFKTIVGISTAKIGDVDGNGVVDITDVATLIDILLDNDQPLKTTSTDDNGVPGAADVDGNGSVGISDVTALLDLLLGRDM